jgi:DNA polymerase I-like protein with 3'-5' exonuclease and polymerase domains
MTASKIEHHNINTPELLDEFISFVSANYSSTHLVAIDTETDSVQARTANLYGIGLAFEPDEGFYIPFRTKDGINVWGKEVEQRIAGLLSTFPWRYLMHNGVYDVQVLKQNLSADLTDKLYCDTILLKHTLDEERPHGLKETAVKYLGAWADKAQEELHENIKANGGSVTKTNMQMYKADTDVLARYCVWDVCLTRQLFDKLDPKLDKENLRHLFYEDEVMPLYREVTIPMTVRGFPINVEHFKNLQTSIQKEISDIEDKIQALIEKDVEPLCVDILNESFPVKRTGNFPKILASQMEVVLPVNELTGTVTLSKAALTKALDPAHPYTQWLLEGREDDVVRSKYLDVQLEMFYQKHSDRRYVFNLKSNDHLSQLLFGILGEKPIAETEGGSPKVDEDTLEQFKGKYDWMQDLIDMRRLNKLEGTYISGILEIQQDGHVYPGWKQFATTSGRYACTEPNLQQLPRIREDGDEISERVKSYFNKIKEGFIAGEGKKIINSDFSQLEAMIFACVSGDEKLQDAFRKGQDLYSAIAINTFGLTEYSADKKADNFLKKHLPEARNKAKVIALSSVYGATAGRLSNLMGIDKKEAQSIIDKYLDSYPQLRSYMETAKNSMVKNGYVVSRYGRRRRVPRAKLIYDTFGPAVMDFDLAKKKKLTEQYWELKGFLNLACNHPIQSAAAYIVNKAMIEINRALKKANINAHIAASVHDEICLIGDASQAEQAAVILQDKMENTIKVEVPLSAKPLIGDNWAEAK